MSTLEQSLDREVDSYLKLIESKPEVKNLQNGTVSLNIYRKFLKTFYIVEHLSHKAVTKAGQKTASLDPYLSKRFHLCAKGELGHAEIALKDLSDLGEKDFELSNRQTVDEYDDFLQKHADNYPLGILGHSYLFENVSAILFPRGEPLDFPSKFIEVHAKEDPGHSQAIRKTVRHVEKSLSDDDIKKIISITRESGDHLLKVFETV